MFDAEEVAARMPAATLARIGSVFVALEVARLMVAQLERESFELAKVAGLEFLSGLVAADEPGEGGEGPKETKETKEKAGGELAESTVAALLADTERIIGPNAAAELRELLASLGSRAARSEGVDSVGAGSDLAATPKEEVGQVWRVAALADSGSPLADGFSAAAEARGEMVELFAARAARSAGEVEERAADDAPRAPAEFVVPVGVPEREVVAALALVVPGVYEGHGPKGSMPMTLEVSREPDGRLVGVDVEAAARARRERREITGCEMSRLRGWRFVEAKPQKGGK